MDITKFILTIRYLGTAGWHLDDGHTGLLIDPYVSRVPLRQVLLRQPLHPDHEAIQHSLSPLRAEAILVTHPHFDHLLDVPAAARLHAVPVYASPQASRLLHKLGTEFIIPIDVNQPFFVGSFRITAYGTPHRTFMGRVPYTGPLDAPIRPPLPAHAYRMQQQFSFLIEGSGRRVLLMSGIDREPLLPADVLIVGPDMRPPDLGRVLAAVQPRLALANHWDDYFRPLEAAPRPSRMLRWPLRRIDVSGWQQAVHRAGITARVLHPLEMVKL